MKRIFLVCFLGILFLALFAQAPVLLRNSQYLDFAGISVQLPNSSSLIFWNDTSSGSAEIFAQKLSAEGIPLWTAPRLIVGGHLGKQIFAAEYTSDGNIVLLYGQYDYIYNGQSLHLQKISLAGQSLWNPEGIVINGSYWNTQGFGLVPNAIGGAYVYRVDYSTDEVTVRNFNANGVNQWPETALYSVPGLNELEAVSDGSGGLILNSRYWISGSGMANHLARVNVEGDIVGTLPLLNPSAVVPPGFSITRSSAGDYFLHRYLNNGMQVQKMDVNGNLLLPAIVNIPLSVPDTYVGDVKILPGNDGGLYYTLQGDQSGNPVLLLNRLSAQAQSVWATPVQINVTNGLLGSNIGVSSNNDVWLAWADANYGNIPDVTIKTVLVNANGNFSFTPLNVSSSTMYKLRPVIVAQANKAVIVWNDQSAERNGLACQTVTNNGSIVQATDGVVFHSVLNGSATLHKSLSIGNKFALVYGDSRYSWIDKIYYQFTNLLAEPLLEANGRALNPQSFVQERYYDSLVLPNNHLAILYTVYQNDSYSLYLQEIDSNGIMLHGNYGILLSSNPDNSYSNSKLGLMGNDLLVCWNNFSLANTNFEISGQLFINSVPQWTTGGKVLLSASDNYVSLEAIAGNYLVYKHENYPSQMYGLRALLLDTNGNPDAAWPVDGKPLIEFLEGAYISFHSAGLNNNSLVCFFNEINALGIRAVAQKLDSEGNRLWGETGLTLESDELWLFHRITDVVYGDYISFLMQPENISGLYLQRISPSGELQIESMGTHLEYAWNTVQNPVLLQRPNGSYSIFWTGWEDQLGRLSHRYLSPDGLEQNLEPLSIATNAFGYVNLDTTENSSVGLVGYTDNNQFAIYRGESLPLNRLWACRVNNAYVSNEDPLQSPSVLSSRNYPNPFNPSTTISYELKEANNVSVEIYNAKGQLVRNLLNEAKTAGDYDVEWNGRDNNGLSVASGVYLYKIQAGKYSNTKKMMLMK